MSWYLHELLVLIIKRLSIFSVVKSSHAHDLFFFVDDWQRQNVFYGPTAVVQRLRLQHGNNELKHATLYRRLALVVFQPQLSHLKLKRLISGRVHYVTNLRNKPDGGGIIFTCSCLTRHLIHHSRETHIAALGNISGQAATQGPVIWRRVAV